MNNPQLFRMLEEECGLLEQALAESCQTIRRLESKQAKILSQLRHVRGLLGISESGGESSDGALEGRGAYTGSRRYDVCDIAAKILAERNKEPMYYKDLAAEVLNRGGNMGGATPEATLVSRITKDNRFVRPQRKGFYALQEDYPGAISVGARNSSSRQRRG